MRMPSPSSLLRRAAHGSSRAAARRLETRGAGTLEDALLRRSVDAAELSHAGCAHCGRVPLIGEMVHVYGTGSGERLVCALCRPKRREAPARSLAMPSPEQDRAVRVLRAA
jgi:hypothetical protein